MIWPNWLPLRKDLQELTPYGAPQVHAEAAMNTNENPYPPSPTLQAAIVQSVAEIAVTLNRYPDREAIKLREALAVYISQTSHINCRAENVWAANGSNEIIQSLFLAFFGRSAMGFIPSYSMHALIAKVVGTKWIDGERNADLTFNVDIAISDVSKYKPALTFITTPNNPTGDAISFKDISRLAEAVGAEGGLLIVDEAYAEFSPEKSATTLVRDNPHVVVIRTMSKAFAFAGARLGYLIADAAVVDAMKLVRLPYHLSAITQATALVALDHRAELLGNVTKLINARTALVTELGALGLTCLPSAANFILFSGFDRPAPRLWSQLLERGVLIRDVGLSSHLRVTVGNEAENKAFIAALTQLL
ncbi:unannotated protein [freshwater metagenome]|uniref:Unannotated protein n=1 Tax=freshwater metagenome TaxID=449393 RepID=A0A6J6YEB9_9ZZZZ|nr:histidinol-phosphate transaminase [Actinomycetota bacterium]MSW62566.1 histidinol-phosphate transaminase [Actinomycetota bacterium]MSX89935.1 histidinol-phosphate transaminase [Actinomycetota bacterium]MSZ64278.1 histidinol-phosphate transaminase [Actinomycetota bacterium]MTA57306.1 histidinol-phosphate transaminase [Actinomycetota bacterium]